MSEAFGVTVKHIRRRLSTDHWLEEPSGEHIGWCVYLPHQCSTWDIAGEVDGQDAVDQAKAIAELERFVTEAQEALASLREGQEYGDADA